MEFVKIVDPMAQLAIELALCLIYLNEKIGGFCDDCTCQFKYHAGAIEDECEICGCYALHIKPVVVLSTIKPYAHKSKHEWYSNDVPRETNWSYQRSKAAREVLRELTE